MKKFSLKKITAAVSAAAMIATMGTTAFADVGISGSAIKLTNVEAKQNADGTYDVTIQYDHIGENANKIGITMLAYGGTKNEGIKHANPVTGDTVEGNEYANTMQIVGVDQNAVTDENKFTFKVTTAENIGGYYVKAGKSALVMVSGDQTSPAVAELKFNKEVTSLNDITELSSITGAVAAGTPATADNIKRAAQEAVEAVISGATVTPGVVTYVEGQTKANVEYTADVQPKAEFKTTVDKSDPVYYKNTSDSAITKSGTVEISYSAVAAEAVSGNFTFAKKDVTGDETEEGTVDLSKLKAEIKKQTATISNSEIDDKVDLSGATVADPVVSTDDANVYTASITVPKNTVSKKGLLTVAGDEGLTYTATITLTSKNVISAISLDDSGIPGSVEVQVDTEGATPTKDAVVAKLPTVESLADKIATYDTGKTAAFSNFKAEWSGVADGKIKLVVTGFAETADTTITNDYMFANGASIVVAEVTVTTTVKPAYNLGDVSGPNGVPDLKVNVYDLNAVYAHMNEEALITDEAIFAAADCSGPNGVPDKKVNVYDLNRIYDHMNEVNLFPDYTK